VNTNRGALHLPGAGIGPRLPEGVQLLKGSVVRLSPTAAALVRRRPLVLTDRDRELLVAVHRHRFLTAELVALAFFPPGPAGRRSHCSVAYERLRQLWLWHLVDRIELPIARVLGGSHAYLYTLGRAGVPVVSAVLGGTAPVRRPRLDRLDDQFLDHDLYATTLWANLCALLRAAPSCHWSWTAEREMRARHVRTCDPATGRWLPFLPDGYFEVTYGPGLPAAAPRRESGAPPDRGAPAGQQRRPAGAPGAAGAERQCCVVEIDTGMLSLRRFRHKLRGFELALSSGMFLSKWNRTAFEVLVLTDSETRLRHLWEAGRTVVPPERWAWYSLATFAALEPGRFRDHLWLTLEGERVRLLYDSFPGMADEIQSTDDAGAAA
jgi:hypothetical protein